MLTYLCIDNFAIVSHLELDFKTGMTAFTGETGAGKSIMIDALMLALGWRADAAVIRPGKDKCEIHACFQVDTNSLPAHWLEQHDIASENGEILLRRVINSEGRSKSYINGSPFPQQKLKELSEMLVDIHGQHQYQTLLQHATHRQQLDQYADHPLLLTAVGRLYAECQRVKQQLQHLENQNSVIERTTLLEYQLQELNNLNLQEGEMQRLHEEHQLLHHAVDYIENTKQITDMLSLDEQPNICDLLNQISHLLSALPRDNPCIKNSFELINAAIIQCEEAVSEMHRFSEQIQLDPERLLEVENRIALLHQTARKFHIEAGHLTEHCQTLENELQQLRVTSQKQEQLQQAYTELQQAYEQASVQLRSSRQAHAERLAAEITATIQLLGMPKGYITIEFSPLDKIQPHGLDKVEYKVCTNPGMTPDTLVKVASGGELSRINLAIHMLTAERGATPTLLFDEVDVGIGGATAALVGELLRKLGERLQIFCVTHQPQVASSAHHHFVVEKYTEDEQTFSRILALTKEDKVDEIARMLGGLTITEQTRSHAREILDSIGA